MWAGDPRQLQASGKEWPMVGNAEISQETTTFQEQSNELFIAE
jgi:hypothetical protein